MKKPNFINIIFSLIITLSALYAIWIVYIIQQKPYYTLTKTIFFASVMIASLYMLWRAIKNIPNLVQTMVLITMLGVIARIIVMQMMDTQPVSDFEHPFIYYNKLLADGKYLNSTGLDYFQKYYAAYPAWYMFMKIMTTYCKIFGIRAILAAKITNLILFVLTESVIYRFCCLLDNGLQHAIMLGSALYAVSPTLLVYYGILSPDHYSTLFIAIIVYESYQIWHKPTMYNICILAASSVALNLFKPLSVFSLLLVISILGLRILHLKKAEIIQSLKLTGIYIVTFLMISASITFLEDMAIEQEFKVNVVHNSSSLYLYWGYLLDNNGNYVSYDETVPGEIFDRHGDDLKSAYTELGEVAKKQFKNNLDKLPYIINTKYQMVVGTEYGSWMFANTSTDQTRVDALNISLQQTFMIYSSMFMAIVYLGVSAAMLLQVFKYKSDNLVISCCSMTVFGFFLVLLLGAVQDRYKNIICVPLFMLGAIGIDFIFVKMTALFSMAVNKASNIWRKKSQPENEKNSNSI